MSLYSENFILNRAISTFYCIKNVFFIMDCVKDLKKEQIEDIVPLHQAQKPLKEITRIVVVTWRYVWRLVTFHDGSWLPTQDQKKRPGQVLAANLHPCSGLFFWSCVSSWPPSRNIVTNLCAHLHVTHTTVVIPFSGFCAWCSGTISSIYSFLRSFISSIIKITFCIPAQVSENDGQKRSGASLNPLLITNMCQLKIPQPS